jgi:multidrug efflux pump subunit AcrB
MKPARTMEPAKMAPATPRLIQRWAVFCSLVVARLLTPLIAAYFLEPQAEHHDEGEIGRNTTTMAIVVATTARPISSEASKAAR